MVPVLSMIRSVSPQGVANPANQRRVVDMRELFLFLFLSLLVVVGEVWFRLVG